MMQGLALLVATTMTQAPLRVSLNNQDLPVIPSVEEGDTLWGDIVLKNAPPPVLAGSVIHRSSSVSAAPAGAAFRVTCETPPCDIYVAVYHNQCAGETEQFGLYRQLDAAGWGVNRCSLIGQKTSQGTDIRLPIRYLRVSDQVTEFALAEDTSRILVFVRAVNPLVALGNACPPRPAGPFPPVTLQHCPGLAALSVDTLRPSGKRVLQVQQDGLFVANVVPIVGPDTLSELVSIDQWGNVISGFEIEQSSVLTFYQQTGSSLISLVWVSGKDDRAVRQGDTHKINSAITGLPAESYDFSTQSVFASATYEPVTGIHRFTTDFPVERSVGVVYKIPATVDEDIVFTVSEYELNQGLFLRDPSTTPASLRPINVNRPFKIVTNWV